LISYGVFLGQLSPRLIPTHFGKTEAGHRIKAFIFKELLKHNIHNIAGKKNQIVTVFCLFVLFFVGWIQAN